MADSIIKEYGLTTRVWDIAKADDGEYYVPNVQVEFVDSEDSSLISSEIPNVFIAPNMPKDILEYINDLKDDILRNTNSRLHHEANLEEFHSGDTGAYMAPDKSWGYAFWSRMFLPDELEDMTRIFIHVVIGDVPEEEILLGRKKTHTWMRFSTK